MPGRRNRKTRAGVLRSAPLFRALGDEVRLRLVSRLSDQGPASITRLAAGLPITRQAVTKHLRVMQRSGLVRSSRHGRETIWQLDQRGMEAVRGYLDSISKQWDDALGRLRQFVEND